MQTDEYKILLSELKKLLKTKGHTYKSLADEMKMSEAGIKRIFASKDGKISTLSRVCEALGFSFIDLVSSSKISKKPITYLSEKQDHYLADHFEIYIFFNELCIRKKSIP